MPGYERRSAALKHRHDASEIDNLPIASTHRVNTTAPLAGGGLLDHDLTLSVTSFSSTLSGVVPASGGGTSHFLRADGAWVTPPGGGGGGSSPLTTKGDLWGYDSADNRIPIGTNGQVLKANSADALGLRWEAVAYSELSGAPAIPVGANPTASLGLAAINGVAATFMRSDAAPALDVTIGPTWSGRHVYSSISSAALLQYPISFTSTGPGFAMVETDAAADETRWDYSVNGGAFRIRAIKDDGTGIRNILNVTRTGSTIVDIQLGNVLSGNTLTVLGAGVATFGGPVTLGTVAGDPGSPVNGELWYNSSTSKLRGREGGVTKDIISTGGVSATEIEVDFGATPSFTASFAVTDVGVSGTSKILISESGKAATGRVAGDAEWDSINVAALPAAGSFTAYCVASPGPVVGKRKLQYVIL